MALLPREGSPEVVVLVAWAPERVAVALPGRAAAAGQVLALVAWPADLPWRVAVSGLAMALVAWQGRVAVARPVVPWPERVVAA